MSMRPKPSEDRNREVLPRSLYVPQNDPRANLREMVDNLFSDKFMIFLSLLLIPIIVGSFVFEKNAQILSFLDICDWIIVALFIAEYFSKLYVAQSRWQHFKSPWHLVDLVIIALPFSQFLPFFNIGIGGSPSLLLRLLRIPRMIVVEGRAIAGRRNNHAIAHKLDNAGQQTTILQLDQNFEVSNITWDDLKTHLADANKHEWLDLHYITDEGFLQLSEILGIAEPHFKSALVDEIYPHIDYVQKTSFIFLQSGKLRYPAESSTNYLTISRSGIIVICNGAKIITVSRHKVDMLNEVLTSVKMKSKNDDFIVPVLYSILEHMLNDYRSILSEIEIETLQIGSTPRSKLPRDFLERIYQLNKEVSRLVSNLVHFKDLLSVITSKKVPLEGFGEQSEEAFHVLQDGASYLNEISHDLLDNIRSIIDLYINETSFETNRILKILAVITAVSVIPTAVSGILGTNLLDVPYGATLWQLSFIVTVGVALVAYTFVKLGWLKT